MKKLFTLSIPTPCHEKASSFTPTSRGSFCSSCQKEVIDFTAWSDERIVRYFAGATNTCGRFRADQLKTYEVVKPKRSRFQMFASVAVVTVLSLFWQRPAFAQSKEKQPTLTEQQVTESQLTGKPSVTATVVATGVVHADDGSVLPGVNVLRKGTTEGTVTDASGEFKLTLTNVSEKDSIIFSFIGMYTKELQIAALKDERLNVTMRNDIVMEMQTVVLGGLVATRVDLLHRLSPRRVWAKLKDLLTFKSKSSDEQSLPAVAATSVDVEQKDIVIEPEHRSVVCYPNPTTDKLTVRLTGPTRERFLSLSSLQGQVIEERSTMKGEEQFNVTGLPAGIYIVKIEEAEGSRWIRVVKR